MGGRSQERQDDVGWSCVPGRRLNAILLRIRGGNPQVGARYVRRTMRSAGIVVLVVRSAIGGQRLLLRLPRVYIRRERGLNALRKQHTIIIRCGSR